MGNTNNDKKKTPNSNGTTKAHGFTLSQDPLIGDEARDEGSSVAVAEHL